MSKTSKVAHQKNKKSHKTSQNEHYLDQIHSSDSQKLKQEDKSAVQKKVKLLKNQNEENNKQDQKDQQQLIDISSKTSKDDLSCKPKQNNDCKQVSKHEKQQEKKSKKETQFKVIYVRKNAQPEQQNVQQQQVCGQQGQQQQQQIQKTQEELEEQNQFLKIISQIQSLAETEISKAASNQSDQKKPDLQDNKNKIDSKSHNEETACLSTDASDRISTQSRKKSESSNQPAQQKGEFKMFQQDYESNLQKGSESQEKEQKGNNIFYTPQKKQKDKKDLNQFYYSQFSKAGLYSANAKKSPGFKRQKENQEDTKVRRQEDRLKMLTSVLTPQTANVNGYLDMGCGNCEITAEIGKVYGAKYIVGCDIYSEDQFVRPADTPSDIQFTYIANKNDSLQPVQNGSLNLITCFMVLHHIENLDINLKEIQRVIADGGYLYIREHDVPSENIELDKYLRFKHESYDDCGQYMKFWGKEDLKKKLSQFGFIHQSDSLYEDDHPNRQKVYHSLFQFNSKYLKKVQDNNLTVQINELHLQDNEIQQTDLLSSMNLSSSDKKDSKISESEFDYENNIKEIKVKTFEIENEDSEIISFSQSSTESEKQQEQTYINQKMKKSKDVNNNSNNLFNTKFTISHQTSNSVTTSSQDQGSQRTISYNQDEIKENSSQSSNRKESPLIWRNQVKNQQEQSISYNWVGDKQDNYNFSKGYTNSFQGGSNYKYHNKSQSQNNQQLFQKKNPNDYSNKYSQNPNYKFNKNSNDFQNGHKKHKESYDFDFDDEEFHEIQKRKKEQTRITQNNNKTQLSDKKNPKQITKSQKPVQLIDILS